MRNMSFALTVPQILDGSKDVTRRLGWEFLTPAMFIQPVRKCMGLRPGEKLEKLRPPIRVISVRREPLRAMLDDPVYGVDEVRREGFAGSEQFSTPEASAALTRDARQTAW